MITRVLFRGPAEEMKVCAKHFDTTTSRMLLKDCHVISRYKQYDNGELYDDMKNSGSTLVNSFRMTEDLEELGDLEPEYPAGQATWKVWTIFVYINEILAAGRKGNITELPEEAVEYIKPKMEEIGKTINFYAMELVQAEHNEASKWHLVGVYDAQEADLGFCDAEELYSNMAKCMQ